MRLARLLAVPVAALATTVALAVPASGGYSDGLTTDSGGTIAVVETPSLDSQLSGNCTYVRSSANSSSVTFTLATEATAVGTYKGVEIVATGVVCHLYRVSGTITAGPEYYPGSFAAAFASESSWYAGGGVVCMEIFAVLRHVPIGESDNEISSGPRCR